MAGNKSSKRNSVSKFYSKKHILIIPKLLRQKHTILKNDHSLDTNKATQKTQFLSLNLLSLC